MEKRLEHHYYDGESIRHTFKGTKRQQLHTEHLKMFLKHQHNLQHIIFERGWDTLSQGEDWSMNVYVDICICIYTVYEFGCMCMNMNLSLVAALLQYVALF